MTRSSLTFTVHADGVRETLAAFRGLPKEANNELRAASLDLSRTLAGAARAAGKAEGAQAALVADTVKAARDRVPVVQAGGTKRIGSRKVPAWKLLFGSEFGSNRYRQFPSLHQGRDGIWFFPVVETQAPAIAARWQEAARRIAAAFTSGPGA